MSIRSVIGTVAIICVLGTLGAGYELGKMVDGAEQMRAVDRAVRSLLISMLDAETGQRGFIITNDAHYLDAYSAGISSVETKLSNLREIVGGTEQAERIHDTTNLVHAKVEELALTLNLRAQSFNTAATEVKKHVGKNLMDMIRQHLDDVELWADRQHTNFERLAMMYAHITFFGVCLSLGLALVLGLIRR